MFRNGPQPINLVHMSAEKDSGEKKSVHIACSMYIQAIISSSGLAICVLYEYLCQGTGTSEREKKKRKNANKQWPLAAIAMQLCS